MFRQSCLVIVKFGLPDALAIGIVGADLAMTTATHRRCKSNGAGQADGGVMSGDGLQTRPRA
jgi:hypothetical protein